MGACLGLGSGSWCVPRARVRVRFRVRAYELLEEAKQARRLSVNAPRLASRTHPGDISQASLALLLPECDRDPDTWERALRSEQLADGIRTWQSQLSSGDFDPSCSELLNMRRQQARSDAQMALR